MENLLQRFLTYGEIASGAAVFFLLLFITAPYGKHSRPGWGLMINSRFSWFFMELPAVAVIALVIIKAGAISAINMFYLGLWELHYIYRTFIFPALQKGAKRSFPLVLSIFAFIFNVNNGIINGLGIILHDMTLSRLLSPLRIMGLVWFLGGFLLNIHSDMIIRDLRKSNEKEYKIPLKGAFRWVSNPNYLGEIIEWTGWAMLTCTLAGFAFAFFTFCNLFPRAISNHEWYLGHFKNYPKGRKIIIPFIF
jgi:protein-S-isoprenylcysteine O-methyltransferase Ste14